MKIISGSDGLGNSLEELLVSYTVGIVIRMRLPREKGRKLLVEINEVLGVFPTLKFVLHPVSECTFYGIERLAYGFQQRHLRPAT